MPQLLVKYKVIPSVLFFSLGICSAFLFQSDTVTFLITSILLSVPVYILRSTRYTVIPLFLLFFAAGNFLQSGKVIENQENFITQFAANNIKLTGTVHNISPYSGDSSADPAELIIRFDFYVQAYQGQENSKQMLKSAPVISGETRLTGRIYPRSLREYDSLYNIIKPGSSCFIRGDFRNFSGKRNPGDFDFGFFYRNESYKGIINTDEIKVISRDSGFAASVENTILEIRNNIRKRIYRYFSLETAPVLSALIIGDKSGLNDEVKESFRKSGVTHVLAVSGLHVGFIILILGALLKRFSRWVYIPGLLTGVAVFAVISGLQAPVLRASVMAVTFLLARETGRSSNGYNNISIAALIILAVNPAELFKPGFQLSFAAAISIIYGNSLAKRIEEFISRKYSLKSVQERVHPGALWLKILRSGIFRYTVSYLIITSAVLLFTLPLIAYYFGEVSLIALISNALVIPLISLLLADGITVLFFSVFSSGAAYIFAATGEMLHSLTLYIISKLSVLENLILDLRQFSLTGALIYSAHLIVLIYVISKGKMLFRFTAVLLIVVSFMAWHMLSKNDLPEPGKLNIIAADVGQGDAVMLITPAGETFMIDAGALNLHNNAAKRYIIPLMNYLRIGKIDLGFISHWDNDHAGGFLYLAEKGLIRKIIVPVPPAEDDSAANMYLEFLKSKNVETEFASDGFFNSGGVHFTVFSADKDGINRDYLSSNEASLLIKAEYGKTSVLFTGDLPAESEKKAVRNFGEFLRSDVLKISHHGSKTATSELFIETVKPVYALISAGKGNSFNHPAPEVTELLVKKGINIQRTDLSGCRILISDGEKISVKEWR